MTRSSRTTAVPVRATRRNTTCDRKAGSGSVVPCLCRAAVKRGGAGHANWGRPGDELYDYDYEVVNCTEPSAEEALVTAAGLEWSEMDELSVPAQLRREAAERAYFEQLWKKMERIRRAVMPTPVFAGEYAGDSDWSSDSDSD